MAEYREIKARDSFAELNGVKDVLTFPNGIEILAEDGRTLFTLTLTDDGLEVSAGITCKHGGLVRTSALVMHPKASNCILIDRDCL